MAATRRELLAGLGAGLVAMQGGALAADGEAIAAARRQWATVGDIERLEREIRDVNQRVQNAVARIRRTGFGPSVIPSTTTINDFSSFPLQFTSGVPVGPGSIIGLSVFANAVYDGVAGSNYVDFEVYANGVATGVTVRIAGGAQTGWVLNDKGDDVFAAGDVLGIVATNHVGTPLPVNTTHSGLIWVSFT